MRLGDVLRDLDRRVLPPLGRALSRLTDGPARMRLLTPVALLSVFAVLITAVWTADRAPSEEQAAPDVMRVGVVEGQSVGGYVGASHDELTALVANTAPQVAGADVYALVTFIAYLAPDRLPPVLGTAAVSQVYARVQLPGLQSQAVRLPASRIPQDVTAWMLDTARRREQEAADYRKLRDALGSGGGERRLRDAYDRAALIAASESTAFRESCSCVYAAVVRSTPAVLGRIGRRPEVRAVDPAPEVRRLDQVEFRPPLPEQLPSDGPAPSAGPDPSAPGVPPSMSVLSAPAGTDVSLSGAATRSPDPAVTSPSARAAHPSPALPENSVTPSTPSSGATGASADVPSSEPRDAG